MRLIDVDKIVWRTRIRFDRTEINTDFVFKQDIDAMPTVEAEPIRHGRWIDIKTELPCESGNYLTWTPNHGVEKLHYSAKHKQFNYYDSMRPVDHSVWEWGDYITHWAYLPEPPNVRDADGKENEK